MCQGSNYSNKRRTWLWRRTIPIVELHVLFLSCYNHVMKKQWCGIDGVGNQQSEHLAFRPGCGVPLFSSSMGDHCLLVSLEGWILISCGWCSCWSVESVLDKKQPFFFPLYLGPVLTFAELRIYLEAWFVTKQKFEHCLIRQVEELFLLLQRGKPLPNRNPLLVCGSMLLSKEHQDE